MDLSQLRQQIDTIDRQIVDLYEKRMDVSRQVAEYKIETGKKVFDKQREQEKIAGVKALTHNDFNSHGVEELFEQIMSMSRKLQYQLLAAHGSEGRLPFIGVDELETECARVVYQGAEGSYSQAAMRKFFGENKLCNDTCGHEAGDVALQTLVHTIRKYIRKADMIIRYGGDEFLLIMPDVSEEVFVEKLQKIQRKIHSVHMSQYGQMQLSISIGGVMMGDESVEQAVRRADKLMYQAKTQKNMVVTEEDAIDGDHRIERSKIKQQLLIVDDSEINREILAEMLKDDYRILQASNGEEGISMLQEHENDIALVLLDILMPGLNGFDVLNLMNLNHWIEDIPVIIISSENSSDYVRKAYELGASDYVNRPFDAKTVYQRVYNIIKLYAKQKRLLSLVKDQIYENEKNNQMMIRILSHIVEFRNGESGKHVLHINVLTGLLLEKLAHISDKYYISGDEQYLITTASALHDIGKIGIDEKILNKPGRLTKEEFEIMKQHTVIGEDMLKHLEFYQDEELVRYAREICRWHHERYDGRGYPDGLKGDEIPIAAQVVSLADVYDALTSERVYKSAYSHDVAMEMILNGECGQFNPLLLECLKQIAGEIRFSLEVAEE